MSQSIKVYILIWHTTNEGVKNLVQLFTISGLFQFDPFCSSFLLATNCKGFLTSLSTPIAMSNASHGIMFASEMKFCWFGSCSFIANTRQVKCNPISVRSLNVHQAMSGIESVFGLSFIDERPTNIQDICKLLPQSKVAMRLGLPQNSFHLRHPTRSTILMQVVK